MSRRGRPPYPDVLTPRQWQVLALLREGLSNEQIARRLGISIDGVKFHVREILGKLGVGSRNEAAEWQRESDRISGPSACLRQGYGGRNRGRSNRYGSSQAATWGRPYADRLPSCRRYGRAVCAGRFNKHRGGRVVVH